MDYPTLLNNQLKKEANPNWITRIRHSARDKWQTTSIKDKVMAGHDGGNAIAGLGTAIGAIAGAAALSGTAASGGLAVLPILGLGALAYSTYSNRTFLHEEISKRLHDPFDDTPRNVHTGDGVLVKLAFDLMGDGLSQMQLQSAKLKRVEGPYKDWKLKFIKANKQINLTKEGPQQDRWIEEFVDLMYFNNLPWLNYVRRLRHLSNYQQAGLIIGKYCQHGSNAGSPAYIEDIWKDDPFRTRSFFKGLSALHKQIEQSSSSQTYRI